jgi:hypothetical protein
MNVGFQQWIVKPATALVVIGLLCGCLGGSGSDEPSTSINDTCVDCPAQSLITLSWDPNPESDAVIGYLIYHGASAGAATQLISDLPITNPDFNALSPQVQYSALLDLGVEAGETLCFRVKAYNTTSVSEFSEAACAEV